mgnify:CR=1 FL=1
MNWLLAAAIISLPHWLYYYVWTNPVHFMKSVGKRDPVDVFAFLASILKRAADRSTLYCCL